MAPAPALRSARWQHAAGRVAAAVLLLAGPLACADAGQAALPTPGVAKIRARVADRPFEIHLQRGACYGRCPQYSLRLDQSGTVRYQGERFVAVTGARQGRADPAALAALLVKLHQPELAGLKDIYRVGQASCGNFTTDLPRHLLEWRIDGHLHRFQLDLGCSSTPEALLALLAAVDAAAGSAQWVNLRPES